MEYHITLPSKPRIVSEEGVQGVYEIDSLYPGYGHTLGNSLRRIIHASLPGATVTSVRIEGVSHEFATIPGIVEDVTEIVLNIKKLVLRSHTRTAKTLRIEVERKKNITAKDVLTDDTVEIINPDLPIATLTKNVPFKMELEVQKGR
ncbi:MAG: DNA-directed RNA polymerase subunit alpha, partial [Patescibacteria group bacterium]